MTREELCEVLGEIQEEYVAQAHAVPKGKQHWKPLAIAASLTFIIASSLFVWTRLQGTGDALGTESLKAAAEEVYADRTLATEAVTEAQPTKLNVNWTESITMSDMDVAGFSEWPDSATMTPEEAFYEYLGIPYEDFTAKLPEGWSVESCSVVTAPEYNEETDKKYYAPHDFVLTCVNASGGKIRVALCGWEEPLRDAYFLTDSPLESEINGVSVEIYGYNNWFYAYCGDGLMFYDITAQDVPLGDLEVFLFSILLPY